VGSDTTYVKTSLSTLAAREKPHLSKLTQFNFTTVADATDSTELICLHQPNHNAIFKQAHVQQNKQ
jgi:hypothetical protein